VVQAPAGVEEVGNKGQVEIAIPSTTSLACRNFAAPDLVCLLQHALHPLRAFRLQGAQVAQLRGQLSQQLRATPPHP